MDEGETLAFTGLLGLFGSFARFFDSRFVAFSLDLGGSFTDEAETPTEVEGGNDDDEEDDDEEDEEMAGDLDLGCFRFDALEGSDEERIGRSEGVSKEPVPCKGGGEGEGVFSEGGICVPGVSSTGLLGGVSSTGSLEGSFVREGVSSTTEGVSSTTEGVSSTTEGVSSTMEAVSSTMEGVSSTMEAVSSSKSSNGSSRLSSKTSPFSGIVQTSSFCLGRE